jgi:hypothetical protein
LISKQTAIYFDKKNLNKGSLYNPIFHQNLQTGSNAIRKEIIMSRNTHNIKEVSGGQIVLYKNRLEVRLEKETVWLDAHQIASLFGVKRPAVVKHINNIYKSDELNEKSTCSILEQIAADGKMRKMNLYSLDTIISVGYRVNSKRATQFRIWATN